MSQQLGASLTDIDLNNAGLYAWHLSNNSFISRFRNRFNNIPINYVIQSGIHTYYVPPALLDKAITTDITFSREGCDQVNCYPFSEQNPIEPSTLFGVTQTSETPVFYGQPGCYNLDVNAAMKEDTENAIQSMETRFHNNRCIIMDSITKHYLNAPFIRTENNMQRGIDNVPGFNIGYASDVFPEAYQGSFNWQYCDAFARDLINGECSYQWWELAIASVLGDSIYSTFKGFIRELAMGVRNFDYSRPHPDLPPKPVVDPEEVLKTWTDLRDSMIDEPFEESLTDTETFSIEHTLGITLNQELHYVANEGFSVVDKPDAVEYQPRIAHTSSRIGRPVTDEIEFSQMIIMALEDEQSFDDMLHDFMHDNIFIASIITSIGFDLLTDGFKAIMKRAATRLIPMMERVLLQGTQTITRRLMMETFKAALVQNLSRMGIRLLSSIAKAIARFAVAASSVIGIVLIFLAIADILLSFWDPYGYSNIFPYQFLVDMSFNFLEAFFDNNGTRDVVELVPRVFEQYLPDEDDEINSMNSFISMLEYVGNLEVNSDGQLLYLRESNPLLPEDLSPIRLTAVVFNAINLKTYNDLLRHVERMNTLNNIDNTALRLKYWYEYPLGILAGAIPPIVIISSSVALIYLLYRQRFYSDRFIIILFLFLLFIAFVIFIIYKVGFFTNIFTNNVYTRNINYGTDTAFT
jgi:hypothetical protein